MTTERHVTNLSFHFTSTATTETPSSSAAEAASPHQLQTESGESARRSSFAGAARKRRCIRTRRDLFAERRRAAAPGWTAGHRSAVQYFSPPNESSASGKIQLSNNFIHLHYLPSLIPSASQIFTAASGGRDSPVFSPSPALTKAMFNFCRTVNTVYCLRCDSLDPVSCQRSELVAALRLF